jgi:hypothetical protein
MEEHGGSMEAARGAWLQIGRRRNMKLQRAESNFSRQRNTEVGSWQLYEVVSTTVSASVEARHGEVNLYRSVDDGGETPPVALDECEKCISQQVMNINARMGKGATSA